MDLLQNTYQNEIGSPKSNRLLDKDFVKVFEPFRKVQFILGSCRVDVKDRIVCPPTKLQKSYTTICVIMMTISLFQLIISYTTRFSDNRKMFYLWMVGISLVLVVFAGFIICARFYDNEGNINLYIKMQEIDRLMRMNQTINSMEFKRNRRTAYALAIFFAFVLLLSYILAGDEFGILELVGSTYTLETFVFELSFCSSHISFFYKRVRQVNSMINNHIRRHTNTVKTMSKGIKAGDRYLKISSETQDLNAIDTDIYIKEIFRSFMIFKEQYRFQVFLFCAVFVVWILFTFEHGILALQSDVTDKSLFLLDFTLLLSLAFISLLLLLVLCVGSEIFMREVRQTKHLSVLLMCRYEDGPIRTKAKNMLKMIEETPPNFSVYGMWRMDAKLVLDIFNIVTNFILTIIQFTFL